MSKKLVTEEQVSGTKKLTEQLREFFYNKIETKKDLKIQKRFKNRDTNSGYMLIYGGNGNSRKFYDFLYKDCGEFYLKRKKLKFEKNLKISSL